MISLKPARKHRARAPDAQLDLAAGGSGGNWLDPGRPVPLMPPLKPKPAEVWRFQRDSIYPDVITGMTKDRKRWVFVTAASDARSHKTWLERFGEHHTIYLQAEVGGSAHKPTVRVVREVESW